MLAIGVSYNHVSQDSPSQKTQYKKKKNHHWEYIFG